MRRAGPALLFIAGLLAIAGLIALGTWQVQRLAWKETLIAQIDARIHAAPVPPPATTAEDDAYIRVTARGRFLPDSNSLVQASTVRGSGYWVLAPLRTEDDRIILINRGFVPDRAAPPVPPGEQSVTGLLRLSEPGGGFLRSNDPAADRWYSRDIAAIAQKRGLGPVAPYFIDAEAGDNAASSTLPGAQPGDGQPIAGLTVISFPNNHLVYAITWYILAAMIAGAMFFVIRYRRRRKHRDDP